MPVGISPDESGAIEIRTCLQSSSSLSKTVAPLSTLCDSLIIEIAGNDIGTLRYSKVFDLSRTIHTDTMTKIPAGSDRQIKVYTIDRSGTLIHSDTNSRRSVRIDPNTTTPLNVVLMPAVGSIYLQLENIPTKVDSVVAMFVTDGGRTWIARAKRSTRINLSLDKIPHALHGVLTVAAIDSLKDTLYRADKALTFNAVALETIALNFTTTPGKLSFAMTVVLPGAISATGNIAASDTSTDESGELLITEIMYAANDSEYVEIFNPRDTGVSFDSIGIEIDGTVRWITDLALGAHQAFVVGYRPLSWCDATTGNLNLSATGNWVTLLAKTRRIIDRVLFVGGANTLEWPVVSGKQSIVLDKQIIDATSNNFGRNWRAASDLIPESSSQYGTPKVR